MLKHKIKLVPKKGMKWPPVLTDRLEGIIAQRIAEQDEWPYYESGGTVIFHLFGWADTPEGGAFWALIDRHFTVAPYDPFTESREQVKKAVRQVVGDDDSVAVKILRDILAEMEKGK